MQLDHVCVCVFSLLTESMHNLSMDLKKSDFDQAHHKTQRLIMCKHRKQKPTYNKTKNTRRNS